MAVEKHLTTEAAKWRHRTYYKRRAKILKGIPSVFITYQKKQEMQTTCAKLKPIGTFWNESLAHHRMVTKVVRPST
ncbi:hypothetical protein ACMAZE_11905 [Pseudopelagicola sp. nBUS_20]|uniref:hypothetical protein n=1 Tax=Pseudopelagicola sp. nBUS_20 TaxID=3395317 RepID=UPI003EC11384